jgi:hypothetical protein
MHPAAATFIVITIYIKKYFFIFYLTIVIKKLYNHRYNIYQRVVIIYCFNSFVTLGRMAGLKTGILIICGAFIWCVLCPAIIRFAQVSNYQAASRS